MGHPFCTTNSLNTPDSFIKMHYLEMNKRDKKHSGNVEESEKKFLDLHQKLMGSILG